MYTFSPTKIIIPNFFINSPSHLVVIPNKILSYNKMKQIYVGVIIGV